MLLTRLMNTPHRVQQVVGIGLGLGVLLMPLVTAVEIILALQKQSKQITELREHSGKLAGLADLKDEALRLSNSGFGQSGVGLLIETENLPIAKANLQSRISGIAATHAVAVQSSGSVPDVEEGGLLLIGLRADISGANEAIANFLSEVESTRPQLLVREFTLRSEGTPLPGTQPTLTASIRLYGAIRQLAPESAAVDGPAAIETTGQIQ